MRLRVGIVYAKLDLHLHIPFHTGGAVSLAVIRRKTVAPTLLFLTLNASAQSVVPTFTTEARSALVWDEDIRESGASSTLQDPLTGNEIHKLSYAGIEVGSRLGYEKVSASEVGTLLNYITTVANNTDADVSVHYGGVSVDGHMTMPLSVAPTTKGVNKRDRQRIWELSKMHCFSSGFAPSEMLFSPPANAQAFTVHPKTAITVSFVTKDPRSSTVLCSIDGCHVTGTVRYYITVNRTDFVFVWAGRSIVYCGE